MNRSILIRNCRLLRANGASSYSKRLLSTNFTLFNEAAKPVDSKPVSSFTPPPPPPPSQQPQNSSKPVVSRLRKYTKYAFRATYLSVFLGVGYLGYSIYSEMHPAKQIPQSEKTSVGSKKKTLLILGTGWGAISLLKDLDTSLYNVIVVSPRNYFLFTPLLPSVPTGTIDLKSIVDPVRTIARLTPGEVQYLEAEATDIDTKNKKVTVKHTSQSITPGIVQTTPDDIRKTLDYDYLVIAVGAETNTFNTPGVKEYASYLKEASDAVEVRAKLMQNIEAAQLLPLGSEERNRLMTFTVVGGGPTGVELAAEVKDYIDQDLSKLFPGIEKETTVHLIEALPNVLNSFNKKLIAYSEYVFKKININLSVNTMVQKVDNKNVYAKVKQPNGEFKEIVLPYGVLVWATGNGPRQLIKDLSTQIDAQKTARRGLLVDEFLKLEGTDGVFALGDCTFTKHPPTAQVAHQQGIYLSKLFETMAKVENFEYKIAQEDASPDRDTNKIDRLQRRINRTKQNLVPFVYTHMGALAYVGSERAVADLVWGDWSQISTGGPLTFLFWRTAYVAMCLSIKNKVLICSDWVKISIFGRDCSKE
ncbi:hypothetical protein PACTADRAFT_654 [Pachysolen tannophilus NRRL Y-2460]|uniref:NADH:ubiquinone reductase (non-electrogenic) n=1 Tax=Pachysolen tannophilus NRRL Y-2460 TaxID=669874 RepID=A0A1E4U2E9_PACTA|nr:hypothetical protein PACTADRAFT_654 [Pachysolen tannophilus NRRL Y-2460]